jgi:hypothetical protein
MSGKLSFFAAIISAVLVTSAIAGFLVFYSDSHPTTKVTTETITVTSLNTIVQIVTSVSTTSLEPSMITLNGTVESEGNLPVAVEFCSMTRQPSGNSTGVTGIKCGTFSSPIHITNQTLQTIGSVNYTYFFGTYSARLLNNATYLLQVRLLQSNSGPGFEEEAGWLPLDYTSSSGITGYGIYCFKIYENSTTTFECNSGFG